MPVPYDQLDLPEVDPYAPPTEIVERAGGSWLARSRRTPVVVGHEAARDLLKDRRLHHLLRHMADVRGSDDPALERRPGSILSAEGEEHLRLRRLCLPAFKQRSVDELRPYMAGLVRQHVASFAADSEVELVGRLCEPYPVQVIAHVLGAPEDDWPLFARWATDLLMIFSTDLERDLPVVKASQAEMTAYVEELIERRRREPGDDLLTKLIEAEEDGDRLSTEELVTLVEAILTGGSDTTRNQLGATVYLLLRHGRWGEVVDDPGLVPMAVEEALRLSGTIRQTARVATEDVEYRDVLFPAGTVLLVSFAATNLDPSRYPWGDEVRFEPEAVPHLSFGAGVHHCLGAWLARAELQEALRVLTRELPDLRLAGEVEWRPSRSSFVGPTVLPLAFTPRSAG